MIKLRDVSYVYMSGGPFEKIAVENVNLELKKGEFVGLIGHTGSGKSTLVQLMSGLVKPTSGTVEIDGDTLHEKGTDMRKIRFKIGLVMQYPEYQLFEETVERDIAFGPKNMKLDEAEINRRVLKCIEYVGLDKEYLQKSPFDLSGGEKRRVAIAGVMAMEPEILVLDEPTAGLDPQGRDTVFNLIRNYQKQTGSTVCP